MANVSVTQEFSQSASEIWKIVGDPYYLKSWMGSVESVTRDGDNRQITSGNGASFIERIYGHDDSSRKYSYEYLEGPLKVKYYVSTFRVDEADAGSKITWEADFAPSPNSPELEQKLGAGIEKMYRSVLSSFAQSQAPSSQ